MPEEKPGPGPARLHRDQMLARLQDLDHLRDLTEPYITDSRANVRENALPHMPEAERAEAEEIIARTSALIDPPTLAALQGYQGQITGLKPGDAGSASFRLPPSPA